MQVTTQDSFVDFDIIETLGLVKGNTIRARHIGKDIMAGFRTLVGGEITEYTKMLAEAREQAMDRMDRAYRLQGYCTHADPRRLDQRLSGPPSRPSGAGRIAHRGRLPTGRHGCRRGRRPAGL